MILHFFLRGFPKALPALGLAALLGLAVIGCKGKDQGDGAPGNPAVVQVADMNLITIDAADVAKFPPTRGRPGRIGEPS